MRIALSCPFFIAAYWFLDSEGPWWLIGIGALCLGIGVWLVSSVPWFDVIAGWRNGSKSVTASEAAKWEQDESEVRAERLIRRYRNKDYGETPNTDNDRPRTKRAMASLADFFIWW
jgi:hypothetical protein